MYVYKKLIMLACYLINSLILFFKQVDCLISYFVLKEKKNKIFQLVFHSEYGEGSYYKHVFSYNYVCLADYNYLMSKCFTMMEYKDKFI